MQANKVRKGGREYCGKLWKALPGQRSRAAHCARAEWESREGREGDKEARAVTVGGRQRALQLTLRDGGLAESCVEKLHYNPIVTVCSRYFYHYFSIFKKMDIT